MPDANCEIAINKHNFIPYIIYIDTSSNYVQNEEIYHNVVYSGSSLTIGYDVTNTVPNGNVTICPNAKVTIGNGGTTTIKNGFECKKGAELTIK